MMSCMHHTTHMLASWPSLSIHDALKITYWHDVHMYQMTSTKLKASNFHALNNENANENMLRRILIAIDNDNKANFNENFRTYSPDPIAHLYKQ